MKKLPLFALMLFVLPAFAIDPLVEPEIDVNCAIPLFRQGDIDPFYLSELGSYVWYISTDLITWTKPENITQSAGCDAVVNISALSDGLYYLSPQVVDTFGRTGKISFTVDPTEVVNIEVKRLAPPGIATEVRRVPRLP